MTNAPAIIINLPGYPFENLPSYSSFAALRARDSSANANGDNFAIDGAATVGDGKGGVFVWSATSLGVDNNASIIRPNDRTVGQAGRYILLGGFGGGGIASGSVNIEDYGGAGDSGWNGTTLTPGTDNWQPLQDALAALHFVTQNANFAASPTVRFGIGNYYFSDTANLKSICILEGQGTGADNFNNQTNLHWIGNRDGIVINASNTFGQTTVAAGGAADGTQIRGLSLFNASTTTRNNAAIRARTRWSYRDLYIQWISAPGVGGHGIDMTAQSGAGGALEGNCNGSFGEQLTIRAGGYGFKLGPNAKDSNAGTFIRTQVRTCGLSAIYEAGTLGNNWSGIQIDECARASDAGYVTRNGIVYMLIDDTPGVGGANDPATSPTIWESWDKWPNFPTAPAWASGGTYTYAPCLGAKGTSVASNFNECYFESYLGDISGTNSIAIGGSATYTRMSNFMVGVSKSGIFANLGFAADARIPPSNPYYRGFDVSFLRSQIGGNTTTGNILNWNKSSDSPIDSFGALRIPDRDILFDYGAGTVGVWGKYTGPFTTDQMGGIVPVPFATVFNKFAIRNPSDATDVGIVERRSALPTSGIFARNHEIKVPATAGAAYEYICTTAGAIATVAWAASTIYSVGDIRTNDSGKTYVAVLGPAWAAATPYSVGDIRSNKGARWICTTAGTSGTNGPVGFLAPIPDNTCIWAPVVGSGVAPYAGTSAASGGPTGTSSNILDGTVHWTYQPAFVFKVKSTLAA